MLQSNDTIEIIIIPCQAVLYILNYTNLEIETFVTLTPLQLCYFLITLSDSIYVFLEREKKKETIIKVIFTIIPRIKC